MDRRDIDLEAMAEVFAVLLDVEGVEHQLEAARRHMHTTDAQSSGERDPSSPDGTNWCDGDRVVTTRPRDGASEPRQPSGVLAGDGAY